MSSISVFQFSGKARGPCAAYYSIFIGITPARRPRPPLADKDHIARLETVTILGHHPQ